VLDAFSHNYRVALVEDATFDRIEASHALALFDIEQKYGDVVSLADATAYLSSRNENGRSA
jgi:isochorismate hydrolase